MINRKFAAIILSTLILTACGNAQTASNDTEETTASLTESTIETTTATQLYEIITDEYGNDIVIDNSSDEIEEETAEGFETTAVEYNTGNPKDGLVYFIQPCIMLYPRYKQLDDWECRDSEVLRDYHYDGEWDYRKELIFAFSNYTDEPVTVDSIQIFCGDNPVNFTNGSDTLDINFTVQPLHKTDYLLQSEDFDYSACESEIYRTVVNIGGEKSEREFYINNCELYRNKHSSENWGSYDDNGNYVSYEYDVFAPTFLNEEQQQIFAETQGVMWDWFWCECYMPQDYIDKHTPDDFFRMLYGVFTKEYADELAAVYIDENGEFIPLDGAKGSNITYFDHCFIPVSADENTVEFKAVVTYCHFDNPYAVSFDDDFHYVMKNTENGWRVDRFDVWN
ncbi:MAG: hypothetical protein ACI4SF_10175 [Oscillospiraceae bacterium]